MERASLSLDEVRAIKKYATCDAVYADRMSLGFAFALARLGGALGEDHEVLHEIDVLEGLASNSSTKQSTQFEHLPLHPFWHKHFSTARHLMRNVGERKIQKALAFWERRLAEAAAAFRKLGE
jgi:hypothetical protein